MLEMLNVKQQTLNQLVEKRLIIQQAEELDFRVSDEDLAGFIRNMAVFQSDGRFNNRLYNRVLNRYHMTPEGFELLQKESMLMEKMRAFVSNSAKVSDDEAKEWFNYTNATVDIDFVVLRPDSYKDSELTDEEIKAYFDGHQAVYKTEAMVNVRYIHSNPDDFMDRTNISDGEIQDYYDTNPAEFKTAKKVEARHILIKLDPDALPEIVAEKKEKALDVMKMARKDADFAELARKYSEGPSKKDGGYLGSFKKEEMVKPFADKAFAMNAGDISEPVRTRFGWHIIKIETIKDASTRSFEDAKLEIGEKLAAKQAKNIAYDEAEALYDAFFEGDDFVETARIKNMKVLTAEFSGKGPGGVVATPAKFASAAFALEPLEISNPLDFGNGYYLLQLVNKIPSTIPSFDTVKDRVRADLQKEKKAGRARSDAETLLSAIKGGQSMAVAGKAFSVTPLNTGFFKRSGAIPQIGNAPEVARAAFLLTDKNPLAETVLKSADSYYIIQQKQRKLPAANAFEKEKKEIKTRLLQQKRNDVFKAWLAQVKDKSEIVIEKSILE
jgi:peptidyl-prolyl cis-trans isomerase D